MQKRLPPSLLLMACGCSQHPAPCQLPKPLWIYFWWRKSLWSLSYCSTIPITKSLSPLSDMAHLAGRRSAQLAACSIQQKLCGCPVDPQGTLGQRRGISGRSSSSNSASETGLNATGRGWVPVPFCPDHPYFCLRVHCAHFRLTFVGWGVI
jgi:hypothetical protein